MWPFQHNASAASLNGYTAGGARRQGRTSIGNHRQIIGLIRRSHQVGHAMPIEKVADLHDDIEDSAEPATEMRCPVCGSLAFRYPRVLNDDKPVLCAACGAFVSTYGELRKRFGEQE